MKKNKNIVASLLAHPGWKLLEEKVLWEIRQIEEAILWEDFSELIGDPVEAKKLKFTEEDMLRYKRKFLKMLLTLPGEIDVSEIERVSLENIER